MKVSVWVLIVDESVDYVSVHASQEDAFTELLRIAIDSERVPEGTTVDNVEDALSDELDWGYTVQAHTVDVLLPGALTNVLASYDALDDWREKVSAQYQEAEQSPYIDAYRDADESSADLNESLADIADAFASAVRDLLT